MYSLSAMPNPTGAAHAALPMEVSTVRLPILWKRALTSRGLAQGNDMATQIRLAISQYIEREEISLY